jgi:hypothetical protein
MSPRDGRAPAELSRDVDPGTITVRMADALRAASAGNIRLDVVGNLDYDRSRIAPQSLRACLSRGLLARDHSKRVIYPTTRGYDALSVCGFAYPEGAATSPTSTNARDVAGKGREIVPVGVSAIRHDQEPTQQQEADHAA